MRHFLFLALFSFLSISLAAQTNVNGNVSGNWTLANSPYLVTGNITVPGGQTLNIQPGVQVVFQGFYGLAVTGELKAQGTLVNPVVFKMQDTTGWYNDLSPIGGWRGIRFNSFSGSFVDSTNLTHCIIKDVKHGVNAPANGFAAVYIYYRSLTIDNCEFTHNQSRANQSNGKIIDANMQGSQKLYLTNSNLHDNNVRIAVVYVYGYADLLGNEMHQNIGGSTFLSIFGYLNFQNNEIHHNLHNYDMTAVRIDGGVSLIKNNTIHHNTADRMAAIMCTMGKTTIESNLICNNNTLNGNCGATDGGGGIHLSHNNSGVWDSTEYIVRNNVIANNHCQFHGGGIYIYDCKVKIFNNHIVHNTAYLGSGAIFSIGANSRIQLKNNLIYENDNSQLHTTFQMQFSGPDSLLFDYNWISDPFSLSVTLNPIPGYLGDISHNMIGIHPHLLNPTTLLGIGEDATLMDFDLTTQSTECINLGTLQSTYASMYDFNGNNRIVGAIDIGAFEAVFGGTEVFNLESIEAYPNPCINSIQLTNISAGAFALTNINGQLIKSGIIEKNESIFLEGINSGFYFLEIHPNFSKQKTILKIEKI